MSTTALHLLTNDFTNGRVGSPLTPIAIFAAAPVEQLSVYSGAEATLSGIVCGQCTFWLDGKKILVRHASVEHVRACFALGDEARALCEADMAAERRNELHFEGAFREPDADDVYEDARERWLESLRGF